MTEAIETTNRRPQDAYLREQKKRKAAASEWEHIKAQLPYEEVDLA